MGESLDAIGRSFVPKFIRPKLHSYLQKGGVQVIPYGIFGIIMLIALSIAASTYLLLYKHFIGKGTLWSLVGTFGYLVVVMFGISGIVFIFAKFYFDLKIYHRTKKMEEVFADYLTLVVTNLKGGMSFEKSLWAAIRPQFDVLADEITIVSKKVMTGNDISDALKEFSLKYDSPMIARNIDLIIGEMKSGGEVAGVIDKVIDSLIKTKALKEEMSTAVLSFIIFIGAIVCFIAPLLFALSFQILDIIIGFSSKLSGSLDTTAFGSVLSQVTVNPLYFKQFSLIALSIISLFSSFIVAIIEKGDIKGGLKYIPMFWISSVGLYILFLELLNIVLSGVKVF